jgi:protein ImuA
VPFGLKAVDDALPFGGLALGAVHELCEYGAEAWRAPLAPLFAASIRSRLSGPVLWCLHSRDLFAPALARVGLHPDRVIYCETWKDAEVLPAMEDGLRHAGLAGVVGELTKLPLNASRRLQLAAESSGTVAFAVRYGFSPSQTMSGARPAASRVNHWTAVRTRRRGLAIGRAKKRWTGSSSRSQLSKHRQSC